jgi:hypothetical protein
MIESLTLIALTAIVTTGIVLWKGIKALSNATDQMAWLSQCVLEDSFGDDDDDEGDEDTTLDPDESPYERCRPGVN